jgi:hypothetical protein
MARERHLIIGLAKTGTTAVAMTLRNTLRIQGLCMEPQDIATIEAETEERLVIKILFDHWVSRSDQLKEYLRDARNGDAPVTIAIVRDPRDEAISRLHYSAYNYFSSRLTTDDDRTAWLDVFYRKEAAPESLGLVEMQKELIDRFGVGFLAGRQVYESYLQFVDDMIEPSAAPVYLLRYEDFVDNTIPDKPLRAILSGSRNVGPLLRRVHRSGSSGEWQYFLTDNDLAVINRLCEPYLRRFNYPLERKTTEKRPSYATGSGYVKALISEACELYKERQQKA